MQLNAQCEDIEARLQAKICIFNSKVRGRAKGHLNSGCVLMKYLLVPTGRDIRGKYSAATRTMSKNVQNII